MDHGYEVKWKSTSVCTKSILMGIPGVQGSFICSPVSWPTPGFPDLPGQSLRWIKLGFHQSPKIFISWDARPLDGQDRHMGVRRHQWGTVTFMYRKIFLVVDGCEMAAAASGDRPSDAWLGIWSLVRYYAWHRHDGLEPI